MMRKLLWRNNLEFKLSVVVNVLEYCSDSYVSWVWSLVNVFVLGGYEIKFTQELLTSWARTKCHLHNATRFE